MSSTGTVERRGDKWRVRVRIGSGRRVSLGTYATQGEARAVLAVFLEARERDELLLPGELTVGSWLEDWLDRRELEGLVRGVRQERSQVRRLLAGPLAGIPLQALRPVDVDDYLRSELRAVARQTVLHQRRILSQALDDAVRRELLELNPAASVRVPKVGTSEIREAWTFLDAGEIEQLLGSPALTTRQRRVFTVAIFTGLRRGELFALQWRDLSGEVLEVRRSHTGAPKGGKVRRVPLLARAREALESWRDETKHGTGPDDLVFPAERSGRMANASHVAGWYDRPQWTTRGGQRVRRVSPGAKTKAGIAREVRFHDLRHTRASHLVMGTWGRAWALAEVRDFLGHSTISLTERYAHLSGDALLAAARETPGRAPRVVPGWSQGPDGQMAKPPELLGTPDTIRTCDLQLRKPLLYPAELRGQEAEA